MSTRHQAVCDDCGWKGPRLPSPMIPDRQAKAHTARCPALMDENGVLALLQLALNARVAIRNGRPWLGHLLDAQIVLDDLVTKAKPRAVGVPCAPGRRVTTPTETPLRYATRSDTYNPSRT